MHSKLWLPYVTSAFLRANSFNSPVREKNLLKLDDLFILSFLYPPVVFGGFPFLQL